MKIFNNFKQKVIAGITLASLLFIPNFVNAQDSRKVDLESKHLSEISVNNKMDVLKVLNELYGANKVNDLNHFEILNICEKMNASDLLYLEKNYDKMIDLFSLKKIIEKDLVKDLLTKEASYLFKKGIELKLWDEEDFGDIPEIFVETYKKFGSNFADRIIRETPIRHANMYFVSTLPENFFELNQALERNNLSGLDEYTYCHFAKIYNKNSINADIELYKKFGISHFSRYPEKLIERLRNKSLDELVGDEGNVALVTFCKSDWTGAFYNQEAFKDFYDNLLRNFKNIVFYEVGNENELFEAIKNVGSIRKIDFLTIAGHGSGKSITLGEDNRLFFHLFPVEEKYLYDITDSNQIGKLRKYFAEKNAVIFFNACSTGKPRMFGMDNLVEKTAKSLENVLVVGATEDMSGYDIISISGEGQVTMSENKSYSVIYNKNKLGRIIPFYMKE